MDYSYILRHHHTRVYDRCVSFGVVIWAQEITEVRS